MSQWGKKTGIKVIGLTVDHGLRKESASEAQQVANIAKNLGVQHHILTLDWNEAEKPPASRIQSVARERRYQVIYEFCKAQQILYFFAGHHLNDHIETFFIRLARHSGPDGEDLKIHQV